MVIKSPDDIQLSAWVGEQYCRGTLWSLLFDWEFVSLPNKLKVPEDWPDLSRQGSINDQVENGELCIMPTFPEMRKALGAKRYKIFANWMRGQACPIFDGVGYIYTWDVNRWLLQCR